MIIGISRKRARQSIKHADEAIELLRMSKMLHEAQRRGLIDKITANEAIARLNGEAAAEISKSLRLQKMAFIEQKPKKNN